MERIYDKKTVAAHIEKSEYSKILQKTGIDFYLMKYEKGEFISSPFQEESLFQIVEQGAVNIYLIRDDGSCYFLSKGTHEYLLGEMDLFYPKSNHIYAEAVESVTCLSFSIEKHKEALLKNHHFLALVCKSLAAKMATITDVEAIPTTLNERVISYMKYKCFNQTLKGIEQAAFHLHCSSRQLQRIMNQNEANGLVKKHGKGTYKLL